MIYRGSKRFFDIVLVLFSLPVVAPVTIFFGTLFAIQTGERPVFRQTRTGHRNREFKVWKLRTMTEASDESGSLLPDHDRMTRLGTFMRSMSIDELPQVINVLRGEMSIVGPRPQVASYLGAMTENEKRRHNVLPGLTGHAQIKGRNAVSWAERFTQDLWYVENASFWLDLKIICQTPLAVISGKNTAHEDHVTMPSLFEEREIDMATELPARERRKKKARAA